MAYRSPLVVRFGDCDPAGIVYYPRYFHYFHVAMEELFGASLGVPYPELTISRGLGFATVRAESDFRAPLRYGESAEIEVVVERLGESSCRFRFRLFAGGEGEPRTVARVVTVCLDLATTSKRPIPDPLRVVLSAHLLDAAGAP